MKTRPVGIKATTLTPFCYHSVMVQNGTATLPDLISDHAVAFGLASELGWMPARVALPSKDYRRDLSAMPYRCSVFTTDSPRLLPPLLRRLNLDAEGGLKEKIHTVARKGNLKDFFFVQEVPQGQEFKGAIFGFDPFEETGQERLIIRIGLHRAGMVLLERDASVKRVRLNSSTATLFGEDLPTDRYYLHGLQLTEPLELAKAQGLVARWGMER